MTLRRGTPEWARLREAIAATRRKGSKMADLNDNKVPDWADWVIGLTLAVASVAAGLLAAHYSSQPLWIAAPLLVGAIGAAVPRGPLPMSESWSPWVNRIVAILTAASGVLAAVSGPWWIAIVTGSLGAVLALLRSSVAGVKVAAAPLVLLVGLGAGGLAVQLGGCGPNDGWRAAYAVRSAGDLADKAIGASVRAEAAKCIAAGHTAKADRDACVKATKAWAAQQLWRKDFVPIINAGITSTVSGLRIAEKAKVDKPDWLGMIRAAGCALAKAAEQFKDFFGDARAAILTATGALKGLTCD